MSEQIGVQDGDALLIVDVQNDFLPGGCLAVPQGDQVVAPLARCINIFHQHGQPIYATRDWHPADHCSFQAQGGPWPPHCVQDTPGAEFAPGLGLAAFVMVVSKATDSGKDAYSGFEGTHLTFQLMMYGVKRLFVGGLATDYCVLATVRDALKQGIAVYVLSDAIRAVNDADGARAMEEMASLGAHFVASAALA
ncbi:MAG: isochorismatase family protein [Sulfurimicrobium sp.]|nr:isochorismatase family protein [Sulfurimicrobium sp.]